MASKGTRLPNMPHPPSIWYGSSAISLVRWLILSLTESPVHFLCLFLYLFFCGTLCKVIISLWPTYYIHVLRGSVLWVSSTTVCTDIRGDSRSAWGPEEWSFIRPCFTPTSACTSNNSGMAILKNDCNNCDTKITNGILAGIWGHLPLFPSSQTNDSEQHRTPQSLEPCQAFANWDVQKVQMA